MNRRGFLAGILAAGVAPAAVGSGILMPVRKIIASPKQWVGCWIDESGHAEFKAVWAGDRWSEAEMRILAARGRHIDKTDLNTIQLGRVQAGEDLQAAAMRQLAAYHDRISADILGRALKGGL